MANVQSERAESARLLVALQQAQQQIKELMQVLSRCFMGLRELSRDFSDCFPPGPSFPVQSLLHCCFLAVLPASDTGPLVLFTA
jgi:hypothetical protein